VAARFFAAQLLFISSEVSSSRQVSVGFPAAPDLKPMAEDWYVVVVWLYGD
jgi:hypothetical protein